MAARISDLDLLADRLAIRAAAESRPEIREALSDAEKVVRDHAALRRAASRLDKAACRAIVRLLCSNGRD